MKSTMPMDEYLEKFLANEVELFSFEVLLTEGLEVEIECGKSDMILRLEEEYGDAFIELENAFVALAGEHVGINACDFIDDINQFDVEDEDAFLANFKFSDEVRIDGKYPMYNFVTLLSQEKQMEITCGASNEMMSLENIYGESFAEREEEFMETTADSVLAHGFLFIKALESLS